MPKAGIVYLVGAGPGDPGLFTQRGAEVLGRADLVVYDALVNPVLLGLAPREARLIYAGKRARDHAIPQENLNQLLVERARAGETVVRLKGGDPYVFGRGGEEAEELAAAGVPFEIVPGISSVVAAPAYAGIPLTHRDFCSGFQVVTGHEDPSKEASSLDWAALAHAPGTKVILMGAERAATITQGLQAAGLPGNTPAAMIRWGSTPRQQTVSGNLSDIAGKAAAAGIGSPAVTIIGGVVALRDKLNWFERRPLFGRRIVVTRTRDQSSQLARRLADLGADVLEIPTIRVEMPADLQPAIDALAGVGQYDWLVFTSPNGVAAFFDLFFKAYRDLRDLGSVRLAAVGPATAAKLQELHLHVDAMPKEFIAARVAAAIAAEGSVENLRILCLRAEVATPELPRLLEAQGAIVDDIAVYRTAPEMDDRNGAAGRLVEEGADWITFTSASTVENFHKRFPLPELLAKFPQLRAAAIGPETSKALETLGVAPAVEARPHTIDGLVASVLKATTRPSPPARD